MLLVFRRSLEAEAQFCRWSRFFCCVGSVTTASDRIFRNFSAYLEGTTRRRNMSRDYVNEISMFSRKNVHVKDRIKLNKLLNKIIDGGVDNLQVVFDFDRTLTKQHEDGKEFLSSFGSSVGSCRTGALLILRF